MASLATLDDKDHQLEEWEEYIDGDVCDDVSELLLDDLQCIAEDVCDDVSELLLDDLQCIAEGRSLEFAVSCLSSSQAAYTAENLRASRSKAEFNFQTEGESNAECRWKINELLVLLESRLQVGGKDETDGLCRSEDTIDGSSDHRTGGNRILYQSLPAGSPVKDLINVDDVPSESLRKLNAFAHIDFGLLTRGIEKISCSRWKKVCKVTDVGVFGVPLKTILEVDQTRDGGNKDRKVPVVVEQLIDYIRANGLCEEGILRIEGMSSRIKALRQQINRDGQFLPTSEPNPVNPEQDSLALYSPKYPLQFSVHDVASVLKQLVRQLPTPLLSVKGEHCRAPINPATAFVLANSLASDTGKLKAFNLLMLMLPEINRCTFKMLLQLLGDVVAKEPVNKMKADNVARIFAPNFFLTACKDPDKSLSENEAIVNCVVFMLENRDHLWTVPASLQRQLESLEQPTDPRMEAALEKALQSPD